MKWIDLTPEQGVTLSEWFDTELEVKIDDSLYKFKRNNTIEFEFDLVTGVATFDEMSTGWMDDFRKIWDHLNKQK